MNILIKAALTIIASFALINLTGQDYSGIDEYAKTAPYSECKNPEKLAEYLNKKAATDLEKVRSYYVWLTHNIKYDTKVFFSGQVKPTSA